MRVLVAGGCLRTRLTVLYLPLWFYTYRPGAAKRRTGGG